MERSFPKNEPKSDLIILKFLQFEFNFAKVMKKKHICKLDFAKIKKKFSGFHFRKS